MNEFTLGIREMTGEDFSWLSHYDLYYPEKMLAKLIVSVLQGQDKVADLFTRNALALVDEKVDSRITIPKVGQLLLATAKRAKHA